MATISSMRPAALSSASPLPITLTTFTLSNCFFSNILVLMFALDCHWKPSCTRWTRIMLQSEWFLKFLLPDILCIHIHSNSQNMDRWNMDYWFLMNTVFILLVPIDILLLLKSHQDWTRGWNSLQRPNLSDVLLPARAYFSRIYQLHISSTRQNMSAQRRRLWGIFYIQTAKTLPPCLSYLLSRYSKYYMYVFPLEP